MSPEDTNNPFFNTSQPSEPSSAPFMDHEVDPNLSPTPAASPTPGVPPTPPQDPQAVAPEGDNHQWVILSKDREGEGLPEGQLNIGMMGMEMPTVEEQQRGFRLTKEQAAVLVAQFRQFKFLVDKGQATPHVTI